ncbi:hypothetical protein IBT47_11730 [Erwinia sp. S43]|uniref:hypothetical protein n=1 Tax=unclassified Erwinia TaxID=2622719 RepID=UPI00190AF332|nr:MULTISPECIES: hypothetical protein [unclassified Erwinia]MBJ9999831.1 hypothetical protein [Erwinia sp. S38]MBK0032953.1 hypothetical protein [Erwinia sp. S43]MCW1873437.1 hypothetical protein [Erwinia sp. INIA01]
MTLTSRTKTILRWGGICIVSLGYFLGLFIASQAFEVFSENQNLVSNPVPLNEYYQAVDSLAQATNAVFDAAIYGFVIGVPLILIIFKKVR